ncbi:MAG: CoA-binding protein, partial [Sulfitobacter sp.]|nr:CoA-binding protein [Sulfitobacter sp.]
FLIEEMIADGIAELLIGVIRDPVHGFVLTLGAGGTLTELLKDSRSLLLPASADDIDEALDALRIAPLLGGYRGAPPVDRPALHRSIQAMQDFAIAHADRLHEIEINPLICTATDAIAADALLRLAPEKERP